MPKWGMCDEQGYRRCCFTPKMPESVGFRTPKDYEEDGRVFDSRDGFLDLDEPEAHEECGRGSYTFQTVSPKFLKF
ncbi:hypothetical protein LXL04_032895 [Taraxacum kok-saghyz]